MYLSLCTVPPPLQSHQIAAGGEGSQNKEQAIPNGHHGRRQGLIGEAQAAVEEEVEVKELGGKVHLPPHTQQEQSKKRLHGWQEAPICSGIEIPIKYFRQIRFQFRGEWRRAKTTTCCRCRVVSRSNALHGRTAEPETAARRRWMKTRQIDDIKLSNSAPK